MTDIILFNKLLISASDLPLILIFKYNFILVFFLIFMKIGLFIFVQKDLIKLSFINENNIALY
jgi:hypothetical protein